MRACRSDDPLSRLQRPLDDCRIRAEAPDPQRMADERHLRRPAHVVFGREVAAQRDAHAQDAKKVVLDEVAPQTFRLSFGDLARPGTDEGDHRRHRLERRRRRVPLLHVKRVGNRLGHTRGHQRSVGRDDDRPTETRRSGSAYGNGLKSTRSSAAKSAVEAPRPSASTRMAASANAGPAPPRAPGEVRVLPQRVPPLGDPDAAHRLARVQYVAQTPPRGGLVHAVVFRAHRHVRLELLAHLLVRWSLAEPVSCISS